MASTAELVLLIEGKNEASKVIKQVSDDAGGLGKVMQGVGTVAGGFLAAGVIEKGVSAFTGFIGDSIAAIKESNLVNAQLDAVLKSTGQAAGVTADQVRGWAGALEKASVFEDEAILKGQNLLLTFTNIGQDTFPRATQTMVDMAQALGTDASGAAIQLGKALNDPIKGITALTRVGVSFSEEQKEQIKVMTEAGDVAGAQAVILAELEKEFGGSAKAASDAAGASEAYKDRMNDLQEEIGSKMLPVSEKLKEAQLAIVTVLADEVIPLLEELYTKYWPSVSKAIGDVVQFIEENWPKVQPIVQFVEEYVVARIQGVINQFKALVEIIQSTIAFWSAIVHGDWARAWEELKDIAFAALDLLIATVQAQFGNIPGIILSLAGQAAGAAAGFAQSIYDGVISTVSAIPGAVGDFFGQIPGWISDQANAAYNAANSFASRIISGIRDALRNFTIPFRFGGVDMPGPLPDVPGVNVDIRPFSMLAKGTPFVPYDNFPALLHRGEAVIPADQNPFANPALAGGGDITVVMQNVWARNEDEAHRAGSDVAWAISMRRRGLAV